MIDDGSPFIPKLNFISNKNNDADELTCNQFTFFHFKNNLGRQGPSDYPGWWRSFFYSLDIAKSLNANKIIHIESDAYILSQRLSELINTIETGWHTLWIDKYKLPETAIQIICKDQFDNFSNFQEKLKLSSNNEIAENILPFTHIHKEFIGDRYSEFKKNRWIFRSKFFDRYKLFQSDFFWEKIPKNADFATQVVERQIKKLL